MLVGAHLDVCVDDVPSVVEDGADLANIPSIVVASGISMNADSEFECSFLHLEAADLPERFAPDDVPCVCDDKVGQDSLAFCDHAQSSVSGFADISGFLHDGENLFSHDGENLFLQYGAGDDSFVC